jgi:hypothetical protein
VGGLPHAENACAGTSARPTCSEGSGHIPHVAQDDQKPADIAAHLVHALFRIENLQATADPQFCLRLCLSGEFCNGQVSLVDCFCMPFRAKNNATVSCGFDFGWVAHHGGRSGGNPVN